jgi:hypothetical protein
VVTGAVGLGASIVFMALLLVPNPALDCSFGGESYLCLIVWTALGLVFNSLCQLRAGSAAVSETE